MKKVYLLLISILVSFSFLFINCTGDDDDDNKINIFSIQDDKALGLESKLQIETDDTNYPILDSTKYPSAYQHLYRIRDSILASGQLTYRNEFPWYMRIIEDDSTLNAFALPGGYMYFYTGIIKFLDNEAQFAGVMAHEMVHVDRRHSTNYLTKVYGVGLLLSIVAGDNPSMLAQIAVSLLNLQFSRTNEYEADEYGVKFMYHTSYNAPSLGDFFQKMEGKTPLPAILSTHPSPADRVEKINEHWQNLGGQSGNLYESSYADFKNSLP